MKPSLKALFVALPFLILLVWAYILLGMSGSEAFLIRAAAGFVGLCMVTAPVVLFVLAYHYYRPEEGD